MAADPRYLLQAPAVVRETRRKVASPARASEPDALHFHADNETKCIEHPARVCIGFYTYFNRHMRAEFSVSGQNWISHMR